MEYKSAWLGLLGLLAAILWSLEYWKVFKKAQLVIPKSRTSGISKLLRVGVYSIGLLGWLYISYAMTGPRKALKFSPSNIEVNDIYMVVDVSRSMLAQDLKPNRLEVAKQKLREFAKLRPTDRIGVIIFSEKVYTLLPLTTDPSLVDKVLSDIQIGFLGSGTNIGDALALAVARGQASKTKNKVIVLLTDGVSNVGNLSPLKAAQMAKDYNMKVYTIGLGGSKSAKIPIGKGVFSNQYQSIPGGSIDLATLDQISKLTNGKSYMANTENSLSEILTDIQKLEKTKIKSKNQIVYDELFYKYLLIGGILFMFTEIFRKLIVKEVA